VLQAVILVQQLHRGIGGGVELLRGEVVERRQRLDDARHDADFAVAHAAIGGGDQHHRQDQCLGRRQAFSRTHRHTPSLRSANLMEPPLQFKPRATRREIRAFV
jgi:hypothetical protein